MIFPDFKETNTLYHIAPITKLNDILSKGIIYDYNKTYKSNYLNFHQFIDLHQTDNIPNWVKREKAIFASLNYKENHSWHSHSVVLGIKVNTSNCWYANENLANEIYEPFILKDVKGFECANKYLKTTSVKKARKYWETSMYFESGLKFERTKDDNYDSEILIFEDIKPENIEIKKIISDHKFMSPEEWKKCFIK